MYVRHVMLARHVYPARNVMYRAIAVIPVKHAIVAIPAIVATVVVRRAKLAMSVKHAILASPVSHARSVMYHVIAVILVKHAITASHVLVVVRVHVKHVSLV